MAQQSINFRGRTVGSFPDDLLVDRTADTIQTKEIVFDSAIDDTVFQLESNGDGTAVLMPVRSDVLALQDGEIFFRFHVATGFNNRNDGGFSFRGETDPGFNSSWVVRTGDNNSVYANGNQVSSISVFRGWNNGLVVLDGDSVQIKIWSIDDPEPEAFTVELTNATLQNENLISVVGSSSRGGVLMDFIGIGTEGDPAPRDVPYLRTGIVTRDGVAVPGADVVFITRDDLLANAAAQVMTDTDGAYSAEIPEDVEMVGIALDGADGDSAPFIHSQ